MWSNLHTFSLPHGFATERHSFSGLADISKVLAYSSRSWWASGTTCPITYGKLYMLFRSLPHCCVFALHAVSSHDSLICSFAFVFHIPCVRCQVNFSSLLAPFIGLVDGENCERLNSLLRGHHTIVKRISGLLLAIYLHHVCFNANRDKLANLPVLSPVRFGQLAYEILQ